MVSRNHPKSLIPLDERKCPEQGASDKYNDYNNLGGVKDSSGAPPARLGAEKFQGPKNRHGTALRLYKFRGGFLAKLRAFWWRIVRSDASELCCYDCGRPYELWWCPDDDLWSLVTGYGSNGLCCPRCFDALALRQGFILQWSPRVFLRSAGQ